MVVPPEIAAKEAAAAAHPAMADPLDSAAAEATPSSPPPAPADADALHRGTIAAASGRWEQAVLDQVVSLLFKYRVELQALFAMFDTDGCGRVSVRC